VATLLKNKTMNRRETDKETKATKKTNDLWLWVVGLGIIMMLIASIGGFFNHDESLMPGTNVAPGTVMSDTVTGDMVDTLPTKFR
jgi:hypothetical protein